MIDVFTKTQRMAYNVLIQRVRFTKDTGPWVVPICEIERSIGFSRNNRPFLMDALADMVTYLVTFDVFGKEGNPIWRSHSTLLSELSFSYDGTTLKYDFSIAVLELIRNPNMYAKINLDEISRIKSSSAIALYEYFHDLLGGKRLKHEQIVNIDDLRVLLDWKDKYLVFKEFNRQIKQSLTQINKVARLNITLTPLRLGSKTYAYRATIERENSVDEMRKTISEMLK
jgi:plasmid replication initiation protein